MLAPCDFPIFPDFLEIPGNAKVGEGQQNQAFGGSFYVKMVPKCEGLLKIIWFSDDFEEKRYYSKTFDIRKNVDIKKRSGHSKNSVNKKRVEKFGGSRNFRSNFRISGRTFEFPDNP